MLCASVRTLTSFSFITTCRRHEFFTRALLYGALFFSLHHAGSDCIHGQRWHVNNVRIKANKILWSLDRRFTRRLARNLGNIVHQKNATISADALSQKHEQAPDFIGLDHFPARRRTVNIGVFRDQLFKHSKSGLNSHRFVTANVLRKRAVNKIEKLRFSYASFRSKNLGNSATIIAVFGQHRTLSPVVFQHPSPRFGSRLSHTRSKR